MTTLRGSVAILKGHAQTIVDLLERGDDRLMANDWVAGQLPDLDPKEWGRVYAAAKAIGAVELPDAPVPVGTPVHGPGPLVPGMLFTFEHDGKAVLGSVIHVSDPGTMNDLLSTLRRAVARQGQVPKRPKPKSARKRKERP